METKTTNWNCPECGAVRSSKRCPKCEPTADEMMDWLERRAKIGEVRVVPHGSGIALNEEDDCPISQGSDLRAAIQDAIKKGQ